MTNPEMDRAQGLYSRFSALLAGVTFLAAAIDMRSSLSVLTVDVSLVSTLSVIVSWAAGECVIRWRRVSNLGARPRLWLLGVLGALWLPHAIALVVPKNESAQVKHMSAENANGGAVTATNDPQSPISRPLEPPAPSEADRDDWHAANAAANRCESLRSYLRRQPGGAFVRQAETILAARSQLSVHHWTPFSMPSLVTGTSSLDHRDSRADACRSAQDSARRNAENGCQLYGSATDKYRNVTLAIADGDCDCRDLALQVPGQPAVPSWRCAVRTNYQCRGETLSLRTQESCAAPSPGSER